MQRSTRQPWGRVPVKCKPIGSLSAKIAFVGEAPGKDEEEYGYPLVGVSGREFYQMLYEAELVHEPLPDRSWIHPFNMISLWKQSNLFLTNAFDERPGDNKIRLFTCPRDEASEKSISLGPMATGRYVRSEYIHNLDRLRTELLSCSPNIIVPLGNIACWALLNSFGISKFRGKVIQGKLLPIKTLPTYHPAAMLRNWKWRTIIIADLQKIKRESEFDEIRRPKREIWTQPTLRDIRLFHDKFITKSPYVSVDIETVDQRIITHLGLSPSPSAAIVIPFLHNRRLRWSKQDLHFILEYLGGLFKEKKLIFQNCLYDVPWLWKEFGLKAIPSEDTMLIHHSLYPEMQKSLDFMGSIYTDELGWKHLRKSFKREDE